MKKIYFLALGIILVMGTYATAQTTNPALDETITLRMGPFLANFDATVKVQGQDLEVDEGIEASDIDFSIYGRWRITPRLRLEAGYSGIDKEDSNTLDADITLGSLTLPAGLSLDGKLETSVLRLAIGYAFFRGESSEFGMDLGVNYTTVKESFMVSSPGMPQVEVTSMDVSEPLPAIGLFMNYAFSPEWYLTTRAGVFAFDIDDIDGTIFNFFGGLEYRPWQHVGMGLAYIYNSADLTLRDGIKEADVEYYYGGPLLYLVVGF